MSNMHATAPFGSRPVAPFPVPHDWPCLRTPPLARQLEVLTARLREELNKGSGAGWPGWFG